MKDAFLSHASEDKEELAEPIYHILTGYGKAVWLDKYEIIPGKSLMRQIDDGLSTSKFGILLITPSFISKPWPRAELQALFSAMIDGEKEVIPVWHNVTKKEILAFSPLLADLVAVTTKDKALEDIALEILKVVSPKMAKGLLRAKIATEKVKSGEYKPLEIDEIAKAKPGPVIHEELPNRVLTDAGLICEILSEFETMNILEFLDNLSRDHHYDEELAIWHKIAAIFHRVTKTYNLNGVNERKEAFKLINLLSMLEELPPERIKLHYLTSEIDTAIRTEWEEWPRSQIE